MNRTVLIAEDESNIRSAIREFLAAEGWTVLEAEDGLAAQSLLQSEPIDALVSDIRMPRMDGHALMAWNRDHGPGVPVLFITAHGDVDEAVRALREGAEDYMLKPFDLTELSQRLDRCLSAQRHRRSRRLEPAVWNEAWHLPPSGPLGNLVRLALKAAPTNSTVLITGESGTGKEVIARFIHANSLRKDGPFVAVNAGAIPESLMESELFGHEKGAFSGASARRIGYFEAAQRGTLFLDEIGELPLAMQVKLLRVLQDRSLIRLGSTTPIPLDIRILAATNRNLTEMVSQGRFRQDLFFRIQVIHLLLPPLRERPEDVPGLVDFLLPRLASRLAIHPVPKLAPSALRVLQGYSFPGNVRELENLLERGLILSGGSDVLDADSLGLHVDAGDAHQATAAHNGAPGLQAETHSLSREPGEPRGLGKPSGQGTPQDFLLEHWERFAIEKALAHCGGNRTKAAELLGICRRTLQEKIKIYAPGI
jgi:two-component system response regulator AtoC